MLATSTPWSTLKLATFEDRDDAVADLMYFKVHSKNGGDCLFVTKGVTGVEYIVLIDSGEYQRVYEDLVRQSNNYGAHVVCSARCRTATGVRAARKSLGLARWRAVRYTAP